MLTEEEKRRYDRHLILPEIGMEGQERLKNANVLVVGAGGLGCPVLQYLTAAGVGRIGIADGDQVDFSNLQRQVLFTPADIGHPKAKIAAEKLKAQNPLVEFDQYIFHLTSQNILSVIEEYDLVIDCTDNFPTRYLVNDACVITNKPLVFGAIYKFEGQVSVFNYQGGPTYRCLFPEPPQKGEVPSCSEIGVVGVLPGIIGCLQASEAIKVITGIGEVASGKLIVLDTLTLQWNTFKFKKVEKNTQIKEFSDYEQFCEKPKFKKNHDEITYSELQQWQLSGKDLQLVDVRETYEHQNGNIGGINIPLTLIPLRHNELNTSKPIVLYCQRGGRSMQALKWVKQNMPDAEAYSLVGGYEATLI
ncbi:molybdopterin-synthase adenylyltransferase MoeB [Limibacter armeniacum]|uniref:molybdopterin-synthase adenylyltransferase MoeB n=1 Tax=Limibacter armeniacum TaxID=466084 RepID=UPI002FE671C2